MTPSKKSSGKSDSVFTEQERAAMKEAIRERRARPRSGAGDGEADVRAKIAAMTPASRAIAERLHALIKAEAPGLVPRTWYGMPAYSKDGHIFCYFRCAEKFGTRYGTIGFSDEATLDEGRMWATDFAVTELTPTEEARIAALVKKALG